MKLGQSAQISDSLIPHHEVKHHQSIEVEAYDEA